MFSITIRAFTALVAVLLLACGPGFPGPSDGGGGSGGSGGAAICPNACDDGNACTDDACTNDKCEHFNRPEGSICLGSSRDPIHGECTKEGACNSQEWTCIHGQPGTPCIGGICTLPSGGSPMCCTGCIEPTTGGCDHTQPQFTGGVPCP